MGKAATLCFLLLVTGLVKAQQGRFSNLVPDHASFQFAGGIGFLSIGGGYKFLNKKIETDLYYGYVPESIGGIEIHSATLKAVWVPLKNVSVKNFYVTPLFTGLLINYTFGHQYFGFTPPNYPYKYYGFPTAFRSAVVLGARAGLMLPKGHLHNLSLGLDFLSFDQEISGFITNPSTRRVEDLVTLGISIRGDF